MRGGDGVSTNGIEIETRHLRALKVSSNTIVHLTEPQNGNDGIGIETRHLRAHKVPSNTIVTPN
jgi:hypothetical protein